MTTDAGGVHRSECRTITEEIENDDLDSAIDLAKEIESLDKLQVSRGFSLSFFFFFYHLVSRHSILFGASAPLVLFFCRFLSFFPHFL
ncbi:unnamed protein product [Nippostrongylus brasiliensis]|uniref:Ovule protein n=1 Tax=Nippostrongylus brasiliensis TaxID=27835 RepID=A0A0N4YZH4_NIPBR|nr:unnamed protein product [Nippostrongylus brasiliensis]